MPKEMTIGSAAAAGIRWENWNDFRARALKSVIADYLSRWTQNVEKKATHRKFGNSKLKTQN